MAPELFSNISRMVLTDFVLRITPTDQNYCNHVAITSFYYFCNSVALRNIFMISLSKTSDALGATASTLCLIHCLVTPVLFIVQTCTAACCSSPSIPDWWIFLDYLFLGVSFLAIFWSSKTTSKDWMKYALWASWFMLLFVILNERLDFVTINQYLGYLPAMTLVFLHLYNRKYCKCDEDKCCATNH